MTGSIKAMFTGGKNIEPDQDRTTSAAIDAASLPSTVVEGASPPPRYMVNLSGTFSLYFSKYYFVVLVGQDKRRETLEVTDMRRSQAQFAGNFLFFVIVIVPYLLLLVIGLYFLKKSMGIDIISEIHWPQIIGDFLRSSFAGQ